MRELSDGVTEAEGVGEIEEALANTEGEHVVHMSPPPRAKAEEPPAPVDTMDFGAALRAVVAGVSVRRLSWPDATDVLFMRGGALHLRKADGEHTLIVQDADILATDWAAAV